MPPAYLHYGDWLNAMALGFGWGKELAIVFPAVLTLAMSVMLVAAFTKFHEKDD